MFLKTMGRKKIGTEKLLYFPENTNQYRKNNNALIDCNICHEEIMLVINEEQNHLRLKENIKTKDSQLLDIKKDRLIEHSKRIEMDEILRQNKKKKSKNQNRSTKSIENLRRRYHVV